MAQRLAHHRAKVRVASSNLVICSHAVVAQQVEHDIPNVEVAGSKPVSRLHAVLAQLAEAQVLGTWRSGFESPGRYLGRANRSGIGTVSNADRRPGAGDHALRSPLVEDARPAPQRGLNPRDG